MARTSKAASQRVNGALTLTGVSQADVGRALGVSRSVVNHRWHGRSSWRLSELEELEAAGLITITISPGDIHAH